MMSVTLHTTHGDIKIELFCDMAPRATENFLALCASDYYTGTHFHRLISGFIVQGGDPTGTGKGGTSIWGEPFDNEIVETLRFSRSGMVAMANRGPCSNQSQFFITFDKAPHLDKAYTIFGHVIYGFDTLKKIEKIPVDEKYRPQEDIIIRDVTIHANPIADMAL
ncbi:hypothetical protein GpartN1_g7612.t1 [Galdieria partita]|uniref:Peptidyl-prolyl cis-trans isomerase n=1 Tax=Galdieria partita TaxID=83374 RepID=A0A9C7UUC9_9RHOD|nr:hypothetical protein GpartN1_g7612.t1 [Galdieria partita]